MYLRTQQMQLAMSDVNAHTDEKVRVAIEQEQRRYRELQVKYEAANKLTEVRVGCLHHTYRSQPVGLQAANRRVEGVQQEKVILEKQLDEISWWKTQYEKDNNLETIARQVQLMREDIMRRDEQISHLNAQVGRQSEEYGSPAVGIRAVTHPHLPNRRLSDMMSCMKSHAAYVQRPAVGQTLTSTLSTIAVSCM